MVREDRKRRRKQNVLFYKKDEFICYINIPQTFVITDMSDQLIFVNTIAFHFTSLVDVLCSYENNFMMSV